MTNALYPLDPRNVRTRPSERRLNLSSSLATLQETPPEIYIPRAMKSTNVRLVCPNCPQFRSQLPPDIVLYAASDQPQLTFKNSCKESSIGQDLRTTRRSTVLLPAELRSVHNASFPRMSLKMARVKKTAIRSIVCPMLIRISPASLVDRQMSAKIRSYGWIRTSDNSSPDASRISKIRVCVIRKTYTCAFDFTISSMTSIKIDLRRRILMMVLEHYQVPMSCTRSYRIYKKSPKVPWPKEQKARSRHSPNVGVYTKDLTCVMEASVSRVNFRVGIECGTRVGGPYSADVESVCSLSTSLVGSESCSRLLYTWSIFIVWLVVTMWLYRTKF